MKNKSQLLTPHSKWASMDTKISDRVYEYLVEHSHNADLVKSSRHAAAIVYRSQIVSAGVNKRKSHPIMQRYQQNEERIYLHAEADALIRFMGMYGADLLPDCSLYVLRTTKSGRVASSKPCTGCMAMIEALNVGQVYWTV